MTASKEGDVTSANEETLQFDDDNLKGEAHYAVSLSCRQRITFAQLTPLPIYLLFKVWLKRYAYVSIRYLLLEFISARSCRS